MKTKTLLVTLLIVFLKPLSGHALKTLLLIVVLFLTQNINVMSCNSLGPNLILNGAFSQGNVGFTSQYIYTNAPNGLFPQSTYAVGSNIVYFHSGTLVNYDHTVGNSSGSYLMCNGATVANKIIWSQTVNVTPNTDYEFSMWVSNWCPVPPNNYPAVFKVLINGISIGVDTCVIANQVWKKIARMWNSQTDSIATISLVDLMLNPYGNDFGIDDITFESCALAPTSMIASSDTFFCEKQCINFFDLSTNNPVGWQWSFPGAIPSSSSLQNPTNICYNTYGNFDVTLIACNSVGCDTITIVNFINEFPSPSDSIWGFNDTLWSLSFLNYQWYEVTGGLIPGAINQYFIPTILGSYFCVTTDTAGCITNSNVFTITAISETTFNNHGVNISPNPFSTSTTISFSLSQSQNVSINIFDVNGKLISTLANEEFTEGEHQIEFNAETIDAGIYFLKMQSGDEVKIEKLVVTK